MHLLLIIYYIIAYLKWIDLTLTDYYKLIVQV